MKDPAILAVRSRIELVPSAELTAAVPARQAIVEIETTDGRQVRHHAKAVRGTPENPMDEDEIQAKALDLVAPIIGAARARHLITAVGHLEELSRIRDMREWLRA
jgi:2-methylcitrate dehydratase PrpD